VGATLGPIVIQHQGASNIGMTKSAVDGCNVRNMEGLAASVLLIVILLGVLLVIGGLFYLLALRLPKRSPEPPRKPVIRWMGVGGVILVLLTIGLWAGIKSASNPQPQPARPLPNCPTGGIWTDMQGLCGQ
jgi:hypothetical protein